MAKLRILIGKTEDEVEYAIRIAHGNQRRDPTLRDLPTKRKAKKLLRREGCTRFRTEIE